MASRIAFTVARERDCCGGFLLTFAAARLLMETRKEGELWGERRPGDNAWVDAVVTTCNVPRKGVMQLRFSADRRTLFWACVLFPLLPLLVYWRPWLGLYLFPFILYLAYCSGVLTHNHSHVPVFERPVHNRAYAAWLSVFYGCPIFVWVPTHHMNHHVHVNGPDDAARTTRHAPVNSLLAALSYPFYSSRAQLPAIRGYLAREKARSPRRYARLIHQALIVAGAHALLLGLGLALHGPLAGSMAYALAFGLPAAFAPWSMMVTNYLQHVECDATSEHDHSRNFTHPILNWFIFDNGFHTVHHEHPGLHWSRLRSKHHELSQRIAAHLNDSDPLGYCLRRYGPRGAWLRPGAAARDRAGTSA
jgi:beta-carotene hydroxylase